MFFVAFYWKVEMMICGMCDFVNRDLKRFVVVLDAGAGLGQVRRGNFVDIYVYMCLVPATN